MRRRQLVELEDLPWCPRPVRDGGTDWLGFMANATQVFAPVAPRIRRAMEVTGTTRVIDLCSGGGGPWLTLQPELARSGPAHVELSDLYPNMEALRQVRGRSGGRIGYRATPVDATNVPAALDGVRTMFNAFHHFPPPAARGILADAVSKRRAVVIVEGISHRGVGLALMPLQIPAILALTPFVKPFRWSRLFFTYAVPLVPLLVIYDGSISLLRLYLEDELHELVRSVAGHESFEWDIGVTPFPGLSIGVPHLVGVPRP